MSLLIAATPYPQLRLMQERRFFWEFEQYREFSKRSSSLHVAHSVELTFEFRMADFWSPCQILDSGSFDIKFRQCWNFSLVEFRMAGFWISYIYVRNAIFVCWFVYICQKFFEIASKICSTTIRSQCRSRRMYSECSAVDSIIKMSCSREQQ